MLRPGPTSAVPDSVSYGGSGYNGSPTGLPADVDPWREAALKLRRAQQVLVFTGAGVSADSGIPTFRDDGGLWREFPPEQFADLPGLWSTLRRQPERLAAFGAAVLAPVAAAHPNAAHRALAKLEEHVPVVVVTQNVDGLHQEAGSRHVHEIHGSLLAVRSSLGGVRRLDRRQLARVVTSLGRISAGPAVIARLAWSLRSLLGLGLTGIHRPDIVLFGEPLREPDWTIAQRAVHECDLMLVVGTSGLVMPAAVLPERARARGCPVIVIDPHPPSEPCLWLEGRAADAVPRLVHDAFGSLD